MAGIVLRVVPKRVYDFGSIAVGTTQTITVAERIDISQYIDCMVALRVHAATTSGGTIAFDLYGDGFTPRDPTLVFLTKSPLFASTSITSPGTLFLPYGGRVPGQYATLQVSGNRTSASALSATVSIDLVLRNPDDSPAVTAAR